MSKINKLKKLVAVAAGLILLSFIVSIIIKEIKNRRELEKISILPQFSFTTLGNTPFTADSLKTGITTIVMIYSDECFHCLENFDLVIDLVLDEPDIQVLMVSSDSLHRIQRFKERFDVDDSMPISFTHCDMLELYNTFGRFNFPTLYLYDENNKLIKKLSSDISTERLSKLLNLNY
ncbi:MAG TPA: redoxin domain-containing protein [Ignavibacteria bacterium]|nr:redoxin domain-containing protein [Ignavibacteria bacterium]